MKKTVLYTLSTLVLLSATTAFAADPKIPPAGNEHPALGKGAFEHTDSNKDGFISKEEWLARGDALFAEIDANKDGKITPEEMKAHRDTKRAEWEKRRAEHADKLPQAPASTPTVKK